MTLEAISWDKLILVVSQVVYFVAAFILNLFLIMIGNFYRKKLEEKMFLFGFFISLLALVVALVGTFVGADESSDRVITISLLVAGLATLINGSVIYLAMKRGYK